MELQKVDLELRRLREEMAALPRQVAQLESKAKTIASQRAVVLDLLAKEESLRRRQESDVKDHQGKIVKLRKQLDNATSAAQVNAFQHEIEFAESAIRKLEDAELESMERSEGLEAQKLVADKALADAEAVHTRERERAEALVDTHLARIATLDQDRAARRKAVDEDLLSVYDRITRAKGTAVAEALDGKCSACQMMLRPQRWNDLRDRDNQERISCDSCGRMFWYDPARDAPQRKPVQTESIAARIVRESL